MRPTVRRLLERVLDIALLISPKAYRELLADDVRSTFLREAESVRRERGRIALAFYAMRTWAGFFVSALAQRGSALAKPPSGPWFFSDIGNDVRVATRSLVRAPAFALGVILTLTVGLGGSTAILGLVNTVYRSALPFSNGDELVRLRSFADASGGRRVYNMSPRDFYAIRDGARAFTGVVAMDGGSVSIVGDDGASRLSAVAVTEGWGALLGIRPALGRLFSPDEEAAGDDARVALISDAVWDRFFGRDPAILGRSLTTTEGPLSIIGVLPPRFAYPYDAGVWSPGHLDPSSWQAHDLNVVARLSPGLTEGDARADVARIFGALKQTLPGTTPDDGVNVEFARDDLIRDSADSLRGLAAAVIALLILACANVANLLTIRLVDREAETTLRAVLGASKARLARLAVVESIVLFAAGGLGSIALAAILGRSAGALIPDVLRTQLDLNHIQFDPTVLIGAMLIALLAGVLTGGVAAHRASKRDLQGALRSNGRGSPDRATGRLQNALVVSEVSLALVLLVGASALFQHFNDLRSADLGFRTDAVMTLQLVVETERYAQADARATLLRLVEDGVRSLPEVREVGITSVNPLCCGDWGIPIEIDGIERPADAAPLLIHHRYVTPGYFEALGIAVARGRNFGPQDTPDAPLVVIVDEALAARFWPGEDPLGKRVRMARPGEPLRTVVGVIPKVTREGDYGEAWYLPLFQEPLGRSVEIIHLMIHQRSDGALRAARQTVAEIDPTVAMFGGSTLSALREETIGQDRIGAVLAALFAGIGLLLACLGLYGLLAYRVALQTREIGTRLALGARRRQVVLLILGRSLRLLSVGLVMGTAVALIVNRMLERTVPGVRMASPGLVAGLIAIVTGAAILAALVPAVSAARLDPARTVQG